MAIRSPLVVAARLFPLLQRQSIAFGFVGIGSVVEKGDCLPFSLLSVFRVNLNYEKHKMLEGGGPEWFQVNLNLKGPKDRLGCIF